MNCPNCGNEVRGNFCTNCGTRIDPAQASPPPPSEIDPGATAAIRPGDLTNLAERESAGPQPPAGQDMGPAGQQPYAPPGPGPGSQQPYGGQSSGPGGQPPYQTPGTQPGGQQPYEMGGDLGSGQQPYGTPGAGPTATPPSGGNWARELGVATPQSSYGGPGAGPVGGPQRLVFPGGMSIVVPPGISQTLAPLEPVGKQYLAWIGAVLLFIGTFLSTKTYSVSIGIFGYSGSRNFWDWSNFIWPLLLVLLAVASVGIAFLRDYKWLVVTGGVSLLILILQFLYTFSTGVSVSGVSVHPSWGWIILFPAALLILASGVMRPNPRDNPDDHGLERLLDQSRNRTGSR